MPKPGAEVPRPIAIVGASCRLPGGVNGLDDLWTALRQGRDLVGKVPEDRFDVDLFVDPAMPRPGKSYTAAGGFLDNITDFDAGYFGVSPKEAAHMDPQHRLLLELAAEAFDDASIPPASLAGSDTAVYIGISDSSYGFLQMLEPRMIGPYTIAGVASSIAANRLSHTFDLRGPSMAVDTACSSSLVALDRACRTLWDGTSRTALCGGANILISPYIYVGFSQAAMLSRRGACASFSADADGFVRAEGGGMVLLKPLDDALADGDRVLGVILGSGSNCDGRTMGLSLPDPEAQEALLRRVYAEFGVRPDELVYVEAHGTGTPVGDPAEAQSIGRALGIRRISGELPIGSVKANLGHLEPASGMAGLCKALLVLKHGMVPASPYAGNPHPGIDFTGLGLRLADESRPLPATDRPVVGINSFGFGGANAHVIVAAAPPDPPAPGLPASPVPPEGLPVMVSARTPKALGEAVSRMAGHLATTAPEDFYDLAYTSCLRRALHEYRAAVFAHTPAQAARLLAGLAEDDSRPPGTAVAAGRTAFVFAGNGSQWAGMAADLLATDPVFRETIAEADAELAPHLGWSVAERLAAPAGQWRLEATEVAQPLLFAVQLGIMAVLRAQGVRPAMVVGHSAGEVAAAYASGALSLGQAARLAAVRGRTQARAAGSGRMAAVGLDAERAADDLRSFGRGLEIAGVNGPKDVTVVGAADALADFGAALREREVFFRDLGLDYAFHSRAMDPLREPLKEGLAGLGPAAATVPFYSTVTGAQTNGQDLDAEYWWSNVRRPVRFKDAVEQMLEDGADVFLETGPHPVLRAYLRRIAEARPRTTVAVVPTLRRGADGPRALATARAALVAAGARTDWDRYFPRPGRAVALPAYPWQRERHWGGGKEQWTRGAKREHPLLGARAEAPVPTWAGAVEPAVMPWLTGHRVGGTVLVPATAFVEMCLAAGKLVLGTDVEVEYLDIARGLVVPWEDASGTRLQTVLTPDDGTVLVSSGEPHTAGTHCRARVRTLLTRRPAATDPGTWRARCSDRIEPDAFYASCAGVDLCYGSAFQVLDELRTGPGVAFARYAHDAPGAPYTVHPALLDGALQTGVALLLGRLDAGLAYLPRSIRAVRVWATPSATGCFMVHERSRTHEEVCWDILVTDPDGTVTVQLEGCRLRRVASDRSRSPQVTHTVLRAAPHPEEPARPSPLPAPHELVTACAGHIARLRADGRALRWDQFLPLAVQHFLRAFAATVARALPDPAAPFTPEDLAAAGFDEEKYRRLERWVAPELVRTGLAERRPDGRLRLTGAHATPGAGGWEIVDSSPGHCVELALFAHQAQRLEGILRGAEDPLDLLVEDSTSKVLELFYDIAPFCRFHNRIVQTLVREIVRRWPADRPLRILEVGAGTGGTAAALLPLLPADRTRYHFTDVSAYFLPRAQARFGAYDFVEYRTFDLDVAAGEQGYGAHSFDLVVAAHALHAAKHLPDALRGLSALLAPGGHLLAIEPHTEDLPLPIFGTLDSYHTRVDTDVRPGSPLLSRDAWPGLLADCGFAEVVQTGDDRAPAREGSSVIVAATPAGQPGTAPTAALPAPRAGTHHLVAATADAVTPLAGAVVEAIARAGGTAVGPVVAGATEQAWTGLLASAAPQAGTLAVTLLLGPADEREPGGIAGHTARQLETLRTLAAACRELPDTVRPEIWLVCGPNAALPVGTEPDEAPPVAAAWWGAARCLANEHPELHSRRIALTAADDDPGDDARRLVRELLDPGAEDEIVLARGGRFVPREQVRPVAAPLTATAGQDRAFTLKVTNPGLSYRLSWQETGLPRPGPGHVLIQVKAAALNYRDMMQVVGLLPEEVFEGTSSTHGYGVEGAGVVVSCGAGVTDFKPGDRVAGFASGFLSSHTLAEARAIWRIPGGFPMTYQEAATLPVACATVQYALGTLARLRPGETVLVHGGAGGVGLAATRYAAAHGAHVIATAGSGVKRGLLRGLGVEHALDSRGLDFAEKVKEITGGQGVDVVLNSLAGEGMARSLELVRPGGRFVELGKRDLFENKPLLLRPFLNNIAFFGMDLTKVLADSRSAVALLSEVSEAAAKGGFRPLPHSVFPAARVADAFQLLQHSRHIGKIVVAFDTLDEPPLVEPLRRAPRLDPEGTYLVVGGTGGFGAATAAWLAGRGARHLALVSRRGPQAPEADEVLAGLRQRGVTATAYAADATDLAGMTELVARIDAGGHPLRGVVHCAMHLDDEDFLKLGTERMSAVLLPKIAGATVLDRLTRDRECDLFLLYSSFVTTLGNVKQAPYVAGNLYLEALARQRRRAGEPALAIAWGPIADVGFVARNQLATMMAGMGFEAVPPAEAFAAAEALLTTDAVVASVTSADWHRARTLFPTAGTPRFSHLVPESADGDGFSREELVRTLGQMSRKDALAYLAGHLAGLLAEVLQMDAGDIDPHARVDSYGLDSLMGAELLVKVHNRYGIEIPPMELLRNANSTLTDVAQLLYGRLGLNPDQDGQVSP
ncbi:MULTISPECIES: type I polyketide synthase [Streptomyces]|uniref:type I polyketide synthase n=1 Tax=Streptomyces TaxID=1883 RepID=UPI00163CBB48|nr:MULTISPECIES: type I polyketide synthase [Streptomyces]MBC2875599.1 SDR family NAD(P)-dependent oxidoreductase [Streptomyces sp. TYQ1024]UBI35829.1 SDR family NAD(P)-dependent oxidoreductase [Streptomyces mobaraensis]UKW28423.1 SDR family NAD(P)-dependent oxidoreductase [Streptomyces sp. TYQ1024]